jgi:hypothetical protein
MGCTARVARRRESGAWRDPVRGATTVLANKVMAAEPFGAKPQ